MRVAVLELQPKNTTKVVAGAVTDMLRSDIVGTKLFTIVERTQIDQILKEQEFQMTGCTDQNCAVQIGMLLSANMILIGEVTKVSGEHIITVRIVDVKLGSVEYAAKEKAKTEADLEEATRLISKQLVRLIRGEDIKFCVSARVAYIMPLGNFGKQVEPGYGVLTDFYVNNLFIIKLRMGFETGYYSFSKSGEKIESASMVPLQAFAGYGFAFGTLTLEPRILAGFTYTSVKNTKNYASGKEATAFEPSMQAGLILSYQLSKTVSLQAGADYGTIFEKGGQLGYTVFHAGFGAMF